MATTISLENSQIQELLNDRPDLRIFKEFGGYATLADDFHLPAAYARALEKLMKIHDISLSRYISNIRAELKKDQKDSPDHVLAWIIRDVEKYAGQGLVSIGDRRLTTSEKAFLTSHAEDTRWETFQEDFEYVVSWSLSEADIQLAPLKPDDL